MGDRTRHILILAFAALFPVACSAPSGTPTFPYPRPTAAPTADRVPTRTALPEPSFFDRLVAVRAKAHRYLRMQPGPTGYEVAREIRSLAIPLRAALEDAERRGFQVPAEEQALLMEFHEGFAGSLEEYSPRDALYALYQLQILACALSQPSAGATPTTACANLPAAADVAALKSWLETRRLDLLDRLSTIERDGWQPFFARYGLTLPPPDPVPGVTVTPLG